MWLGGARKQAGQLLELREFYMPVSQLGLYLSEQILPLTIIMCLV